MPKILIIGSEGNIGKILVSYLRDKEYDVICADIVSKIEPKYYQVDINIPLDLLKVFDKEQPDICYLLAAVPGRLVCENSPSIAIMTNIIGVQNIIELCKFYNTKFIFISSSEIYGNQNCLLDEGSTVPMPNNRYGLSKLIAEQLIQYEVKYHNLQAVILRPFMFYHETETHGEHRSVIIRFVENLHLRKPIIIHKNSVRSWIYLDDAVIALEKAAFLNEFEIINVGSNEYIYTVNLAQKIAEKMDIDLDQYAIYIELPPQMTLIKNPNLSKMYELFGDIIHTSLDEGLNRVISGFRHDHFIHNTSLE